MLLEKKIISVYFKSCKLKFSLRIQHLLAFILHAKVVISQVVITSGNLISKASIQLSCKSGFPFYRHPLPIRMMHWGNVVFFTFLLMSGLNILEAHPALYWGVSSYQGAPPVLAFQGAFPSWMTIPAHRWLAMARRWHFFCLAPRCKRYCLCDLFHSQPPFAQRPAPHKTGLAFNRALHYRSFAPEASLRRGSQTIQHPAENVVSGSYLFPLPLHDPDGFGNVASLGFTVPGLGGYLLRQAIDQDDSLRDGLCTGAVYHYSCF